MQRKREDASSFLFYNVVVKKKRVKVILLIVLFLSFGVYRYFFHNLRIEVEYDRTVDGDTMYFIIDGTSTKCRLIGINTPEIDKNEEFAYEAKNFSKGLLESGKKIEIEYDEEAGKQDQYGRHLVYVFVDNILLEEELLKEGLAKVEFVYGDYKYLNRYYIAQNYAKENGFNLWRNEE